MTKAVKRKSVEPDLSKLSTEELQTSLDAAFAKMPFDLGGGLGELSCKLEEVADELYGDYFVQTLYNEQFDFPSTERPDWERMDPPQKAIGKLLQLALSFRTQRITGT